MHWMPHVHAGLRGGDAECLCGAEGEVRDAVEVSQWKRWTDGLTGLVAGLVAG